MAKVCSECGGDEDVCVECGKKLPKTEIFHCYRGDHFCSEECWQEHASMDLEDAQWEDEKKVK